MKALQLEKLTRELSGSTFPPENSIIKYIAESFEQSHGRFPATTKEALEWAAKKMTNPDEFYKFALRYRGVEHDLFLAVPRPDETTTVAYLFDQMLDRNGIKKPINFAAVAQKAASEGAHNIEVTRTVQRLFPKAPAKSTPVLDELVRTFEKSYGNLPKTITSEFKAVMMSSIERNADDLLATVAKANKMTLEELLALPAKSRAELVKPLERMMGSILGEGTFVTEKVAESAAALRQASTFADSLMTSALDGVPLAQDAMRSATKSFLKANGKLPDDLGVLVRWVHDMRMTDPAVVAEIAGIRDFRAVKTQAEELLGALDRVMDSGGAGMRGFANIQTLEYETTLLASTRAKGDPCKKRNLGIDGAFAVAGAVCNLAAKKGTKVSQTYRRMVSNLQQRMEQCVAGADHGVCSIFKYARELAKRADLTIGETVRTTWTN